jgi:hypothetical protein
MPERPEPSDGSAPPAPSSRTETTSLPFRLAARRVTREAYACLAAWEGLRAEPEAYFDLGEQTLAFYVLRARGRQSGLELALPIAALVRWRDGLASTWISGRASYLVTRRKLRGARQFRSANVQRRLAMNVHTVTGGIAAR